MDEIHPNALKHLSAEQVMQAWDSVSVSIKRESDDEPPRWLCIGWLSDGTPAEIIAVEKLDGWLIIHANAPVCKRFEEEITRTMRRSR